MCRRSRYGGRDRLAPTDTYHCELLFFPPSSDKARARLFIARVLSTAADMDRVDVNGQLVHGEINAAIGRGQELRLPLRPGSATRLRRACTAIAVTRSG